MSGTATRGELAALLSTIDGVTGFVNRPATIKAGAAWPLLRSVTRAAGLAFEWEWQIVVALGGDELAAQAKLDQLLPTLAVTLDPVAYVDSATPIVINTNAGDVFAVEITARSE